MKDKIDIEDPLNLGYWCEFFACSEEDLLQALEAMKGAEICDVSFYLETRLAMESFIGFTGDFTDTYGKPAEGR